MLMIMMSIPRATIRAITRHNKGATFCAHHPHSHAAGCPPHSCATSNQSQRHPEDQDEDGNVRQARKFLQQSFQFHLLFLKNMTASHQICTELAVLSVGPWLYVRLPVNSNSQNPKITPNAAIPIWSSVLLSTSSMLPPILIESIEIMPLLSVTALSTVKDSEHSLNIFHRKVNHKRLSYWSW